MNTLLGFFMLLTTGFLYAVNDILLRYVGAELTTFQQTVIRCIGGLIFALVIIVFSKTKLHFGKTKKTFIILYGITFPLTVILFTTAIVFTKIAAAIFACYSASFIFSLLLGNIVFHEKITGTKIIALILVIIGIIFITYPFSSKDINVGFLCAIAAGIMLPINSAFNKHFGNKIKKPLLMMTQMIGGIIIGSIFVGITNQSFFPHPTLGILLLSILSGIILVSTVYLTLVGFQNFDLHLGTIITSSEFLFAPLFAFILFQERLTTLQIFGAMFITLAIIIPHLKPLIRK